ncbi:mitochondrial proton/calcium exchanger protein-like protein isoform X1 [Tanacetum coccineum]
MQEVILFYNGLDVLTRQILNSKGVIPTKTYVDAKVAIQEMAEYSQKWHNRTFKIRSTETSDGLVEIQAQLNNLGREIKKVSEKVYVAQVGCEQWQYRAATSGFYQRNNANPSYQERRQSMEESLSKFMSESEKRHEKNSNLIKEIRASTDTVIRNQKASIKTLEIQIGQMSKVLQERRFRSLPSSTETNPKDHVKSISTTVKADMTPIHRIGSSEYTVPAQQNTTRIDDSLPRKEKDPESFTLLCYINNVCFDNALADLGASISVMPLSTYLNLGLGELAHTKLTVELADRIVKYPKGIAENVLVGIELRRDQVDDLMPTIEEGEVIDEPMIDIIKNRNNESFDEYPSFCDFDQKIHIDYAYNLRFSCMIVENMNGYRDQDMGDIIFREPFCKASCVEARRSFYTATSLEKKSKKLVKYRSSGILCVL